MKGKSNGHRRALVESTGDRDVPVVRFCNPLGDRQAKTRSFAPPRAAAVDDVLRAGDVAGEPHLAAGVGVDRGGAASVTGGRAFP
mgnify:CR=1 FL=1